MPKGDHVQQQQCLTEQKVLRVSGLQVAAMLNLWPLILTHRPFPSSSANSC